MLTLDNLKSLTPAVFSTSARSDVSSAYQFIPSLPIVEELLAKGWTIRSARQNKVLDPFAQHRITFDVPNAPRTKKVGEVWPTATLFNSHDRTKRLSFTIGFFRTICSNQAQASVFSDETSRIHLTGAGVDLNIFVAKLLEGFGTLPPKIEKMSETLLSVPQQLDFGRKALSVKQYLNTNYKEAISFTRASEIITPKREADQEPSVWNLFNRVQENILRGPKGGTQEVRMNRAVNLGLWEMAQEYINN